MPSNYKGYTIPDLTDPADATQAFKDFVDSGPRGLLDYKLFDTAPVATGNRVPTTLPFAKRVDLYAGRLYRATFVVPVIVVSALGSPSIEVFVNGATPKPPNVQFVLQSRPPGNSDGMNAQLNWQQPSDAMGAQVDLMWRNVTNVAGATAKAGDLWGLPSMFLEELSV